MILRLHVLPGLRSRQITNVTPPDIQALVNGQAEAQAPFTVHHQHTCLAAMFSYVVDSDRLAQTPCRRIGLPQVREKARPELSAEQLCRLAGELGPDQGPMMRLGAVGGLRFAGCAGITVDRLDLLDGTVTIDRQLLKDGSLSGPKTGAGHRTVAIPCWLAKELAGVLGRRGLGEGDPRRLRSGDRRCGPPGGRRCGPPGGRSRRRLPPPVVRDLRARSRTALPGRAKGRSENWP